MSRDDGPTLEDAKGGMRAGRTAPNNKTAGGAREDQREARIIFYAEITSPGPWRHAKLKRDA